jgi:hypothetical protein
MSYRIELREEWHKHPSMGTPTSRWDWFVYDEEDQLVDQGSTQYSETDARKYAERAATLYHRQQHAKRVEYEFTPEG